MEREFRQVRRNKCDGRRHLSPADVKENVNAVPVWKHDVQNRDVRNDLAQQSPRAGDICRHDRFQPKRIRQRFQNQKAGRVIVGDQRSYRTLIAIQLAPRKSLTSAFSPPQSIGENP